MTKLFVHLANGEGQRYFDNIIEYLSTAYTEELKQLYTAAADYAYWRLKLEGGERAEEHQWLVTEITSEGVPNVPEAVLFTEWECLYYVLYPVLISHPMHLIACISPATDDDLNLIGFFIILHPN